MTFGEEGKVGVRTASLTEAQGILDVFFSHGHRELDTARMYAEGTTEQYLAKLNLNGSSVDTKVYPIRPGDHAPNKLRSTFETSLGHLVPAATQKVRVLYLHAPDRSIPFVETLREADKLYKEGKFEQLGLSNYASWEVAEIVGLCEKEGLVKPTIYQAMYNALTRAVEPELVPCLQKFGLRLVIYNPLAGGLFAGKVSKGEEAPEGRFGGESIMAKMYRARYLRDGYFAAMEDISAVAKKHGLTTIEIALRWCQHHSALSPTDGVILGASSAAQLEQNCTDSAKGPLPQEVVDVLDTAWLKVAGTGPTYWR